MKGLIAVLVVVFFFGVPPVRAHDIGVSLAELVEQDGNKYELSVRTGALTAAIFATPNLPEHCEFTSNPRGIQAPGWRKFTFSCVDGLTAYDTLELPWLRDGVLLNAIWLDGQEVERLFLYSAGRIEISLSELQAGSGSLISAAKRYTRLGIEHILLGFDHLLFVLALLLIVHGAWPLVKTVTAFTVAHSITLGLATLGFINVPTRPVEAAIALSIVFLCVEIVHARQHRFGMTFRFPWLIAFAFGLLHGLGFAGALATIGIPQSEIPVALLFFNIGVETGQLIFIAAVLLLLWLLRGLRLDTLKWARAVPAYVIGTLATYWFVERVGMMLPIQ